MKIRFNLAALFDAPALADLFNAEAAKAANFEDGLFFGDNTEFHPYIVFPNAEGGIYEPAARIDAARRVLVISGKEGGTHWSRPDTFAEVDEGGRIVRTGDPAPSYFEPPFSPDGAGELSYELYVETFDDLDARAIFDAFGDAAKADGE